MVCVYVCVGGSGRSPVTESSAIGVNIINTSTLETPRRASAKCGFKKEVM